MQLYVADYLADTAHLTALEHGAYLLLMFNYWQRGEPFKAKDEQSLNKRLATVARLSLAEWEEVRETLEDFFEVTDTEWSHRRIDRDLETVNAKSGKAKAAGKASAKRRSSERSADAEQTLSVRSTSVEQTLNHTDTEADTEVKPSHSRGRGRCACRAGAGACPTRTCRAGSARRRPVPDAPGVGTRSAAAQGPCRDGRPAA
ncbi:YdaU family protein [Azotobacter sp. CWF10]